MQLQKFLQDAIRDGGFRITRFKEIFIPLLQKLEENDAYKEAVRGEFDSIKANLKAIEARLDALNVPSEEDSSE